MELCVVIDCFDQVINPEDLSKVFITLIIELHSFTIIALS